MAVTVELEASDLAAIAAAIRADQATELAAIVSIPTNPVLDNDARLDNLDSAVSDCLQAADYTAPDNAGIAALPDAATIATAVMHYTE